MSYCSISDIRTLVPKFTILAVPDTTVQMHIDNADALIDSKIVAHYVLPLSTVPKIVKSVSQQIAIYYILCAGFTQDSQNKSRWADVYEKAIALLDKMSGGDMVLTDNAGNALPNHNWLKSSTQGYIPIFDVGPTEEQVVDSSELTDIADSKDSNL